MIKNTITNAADISILKLIDNTYKTGGGPASVGGCVVQANKGLPGRPMYVTDNNWRDLLGKPMHQREGEGAEGLRHLGEATKDCQGVQVVRVLSETAKFPSLDLNNDGTFTEDAHAFGTDVTAGTGVLMTVFPKDGDPSTKRTVYVAKVDEKKGRVTLQVLEPDSQGVAQVVESLTFGLDPDDTDDMGNPAYVDAVFDSQSDILDVAFNTDATLAEFKEFTEPTPGDPADPHTFVGGTNGEAPTAADYKKAWSVFRDMRVNVNFLFAAGCYETDVLGEVAEIADGRHIQFFFDAPPHMDSTAAIEWLETAGLQSRQSNCYHGAYSFTDPYFGGRSTWGYSGAVAASRARGNAQVRGNVPGIHLAAAGAKRGVINRRGAKPLNGREVLDKDALYEARLNPILANENGPGVVIGDDLALHFEENYSRFGWVNSITNYIVHRFLQAASAAKFEPDGLTRDVLTDLTVEIMEELVTAGVLVKPRNPDADGDSPFIVTVEQLEIDLWKVTWEVCPTGAARRIAGQPKLIK